MNEKPPSDGPETPPDRPETPPDEGAPPPPSKPPPPSEPPPPQAPPGGPPPSGDKTVMFVLSYLWILALVPLLTDKDPEVQWHAKNGIMFMAGELVIWIAYWILSFITGVFLGCFLAILGLAALIAFVAIHVLAIVKATRGERLRLPVVSDFADQWQ